MRKAIIAGNWKMNNTIEEGLKLVEELKGLVKDAKCDVVVCPPFIALDAVLKAVKGTNIKVGAQNMHFEEKGAYTGEVAPEMLEKMGVEYVIIGHSERRQYFNETDETVNKKVKKALEHNLIPISCCGESLEERETNVTEEVLGRQIKLNLAGLTTEQVEKVVVAYEPIWAIGTGKTATNEQANEVCAIIRATVKELYGEEVSNYTRIQYGGSVNAKNAAEIFAMSDIDGGLVGGASLKVEDFTVIAKA